MRTLLLPPIILLLSGSAVPSGTPLPDLTAFWCGSDPVRVAGPPKLLDGYGPGGFAIATKIPQAQAFFNNGIQLAHAFAHQAAIDAFEEARRLDPSCAMCAWGHAWSLGPTINYGADDATKKRAADIVVAAEQLAVGAPERDKQLIAALKLRYAAEGGNKAFAEAMETLAKAHPADDALLTLAADALMIAGEGNDYSRPVGLLETVLKRNPDYAPAIHFYIHVTEWAEFPERAERYADRLGVVAPAASHLVHMPSHTYYWIGRYRDAGLVNLRAAEIGIEQATALGLAQPPPDGSLPNYHLHNVHFGIGGALMAGDAPTGLAIARKLVAGAKLDTTQHWFAQRVIGHGYIGLARFAPPEEMLRVPAPGKANPVAQALWHYARGEALARKGDTAGMVREARAMERRISDEKGSRLMSAVGRHVLLARAAMMRGDLRKAASEYAKATKAEETEPLGKSADPPAWWFPVRRSLASVLLAQGDAAGALREVDAAMKRRPRDPVAHAIRADALTKLGRAEEAARSAEEARKGWAGEATALRGPLA